MSCLRVNPPGEPVRLIDLGPANATTGRNPFDAARGAVVVGDMVPFIGATAYIATNAELERRRRRQRTTALRSDPEACRSRQEVKA